MRSLLPKNLEIAVGLRVLSTLQFVYERTDGRLGARIGPYKLLLLRTRGRRSGQVRTSELLYVEDGDKIVVVGSKGGSDSPPAWLLNLQADPDVEVQVGSRRWRTQAQMASPDERRRLWPIVTGVWSDYARYQARSVREIPLVLLAR
jgi:deazaflavin-dependent oxidoreductase (nitroreductase family)